MTVGVRRILTTGATLLAAGALGACGSSSGQQAASQSTPPPADNGIAVRSPAAILDAARTAATSARTLHVAGQVVRHGSPIAFDLRLVVGQGSLGELTAQGLTVKFITVGHVLYLNGGMQFWRAFGGVSLARRLDGRWVQVPSTVNVAKVARLTNLSVLFGSILPRGGTFVKGQASTVGGQRVLALHSTTRGGTLYVATTGPPYPIEIRGNRRHPGDVVFNQYNQPITLRAPSNALNAAALTGA